MTFWASNPFYFILMQFDSTQLVHMQSIIFKYILYVCTKCHVLKVKYFNIQVINYENLNITENTAHNKYALLISHKIDDGFVQWQYLSLYFQKILVKTKKNQCKTQKNQNTQLDKFLCLQKHLPHSKVLCVGFSPNITLTQQNKMCYTSQPL